ncbi:MAG: beta-N-acetylhexosaminidase, partial [Betaproteobacteria bacterium]|nr:beta-N-acetylhexosaminidase [Betaproteobacteria bacterium]
MTPIDRALLPLGPVMVDIEGYTLKSHERERLCHPMV